MIDYVKINLSNLSCSELEANTLLDFKFSVSTKTGEVNQNHKVAEYNSLKFEIINETYIKLSGSLHKYWCNGSNYNNYNFDDFTSTVIDLNNKFKVNPFFARFENLEFAVNIHNPPVNPTAFTKLIINHKGTPFNKMKSYNISLGVDCYHQQYGIKIYDKGKQYNLKDKVLRYEIKAKKMIFLKKEGIVYLADLLSPNKFIALGAKLTSSFDDVLINEGVIRIEDVKPLERLILSDGRNPKFWEELKAKHPKTHDYKRKRFRELLRKYSNSNLQEELKTLIIEKYNLLAKYKPETLAKLTTFLKGLSERKGSNTLAKLTTFTGQSEKEKFSQINRSSSRLICQIQGLENSTNLPPISEVPKEQCKLTYSPPKDKIINRCKTCQSDISDFPRASYCNEKCRDAFELYIITQKVNKCFQG